jgi:hypothetical protein
MLRNLMLVRKIVAAKVSASIRADAAELDGYKIYIYPEVQISYR